MVRTAITAIDLPGALDYTGTTLTWTAADLTDKNANVFYEVGICHAIDKPVLLMAQSIDDVPFDLRHRRILLYEYSPRGCKKLEKALQENILTMLENLG